MIDAIKSGDLVASAVLSGNRNFEGRVNPYVKANYLASPLHVVAFALAGSVDFDPETDALGTGKDGQPVYLKDIWPTTDEVKQTVESLITADMFKEEYAPVFEGTEAWQALQAPTGNLYQWSVHLHPMPTVFDGFADFVQDIIDARVMALLGDSVTTDHISAGAIPEDYPAGRYLKERGVELKTLTPMARGVHEVMMRGTFANVRLRNLLVPGIEGGFTKYHPSGETMYIYDASMQYQASNTPLVVIGGKEYGTGSSRTGRKAPHYWVSKP